MHGSGEVLSWWKPRSPDIVREQTSTYLDAHFEACRPAYEAMLRSVGLEPGWRVLDAACGSGGFLPLIAEQIGPNGSIAAFDIASGGRERKFCAARRSSGP